MSDPEMPGESKDAYLGNSHRVHPANGADNKAEEHPLNGAHDNSKSNDPTAVKFSHNGAAAVTVDNVDVSEDEDKKKKKEKKEKPKMVGMLELFRFADKLDVLCMIVGTIAACLHGVAMPALLLVFGDMIDKFVGSAPPSSGNVTFVPSKPCITKICDNITVVNVDGATVLDTIRETAVYYAIIGVAVLIVGYFQVTFWLITSYRQTFKVRTALLAAVLRQEIGWFDTNDPGQISTRLSDDVNKVQEGIGDKIGNFFQWFMVFVAGMIIGFIRGWKLALVILSVAPVIAVAGGLMTYLITSTTKKELSAYAKAGAVAEEVLSSIRTVVAFGGQDKECKRYNCNLAEARSYGVKKSMVAGGGMGLVFFVLFSCYALAFWYGGKLVREDCYTVGKMLIVFFCVVFGAFGIGNAFPNLQNVSTARGAAYVIWDIIDRKSLIDSSSSAGVTPQQMLGHIELKNVVFRYPSRTEVQILNKLSLSVQPGQTVALVGASGCGKSTVTQLLQRFYDPEDGTVEIDGNDVKSLNVQWLRQHIGVVSQEPILFNMDIAENIRYGRDGVTQDEIERAAREANAHNFISKLPKKYQTLVGERGAQLSGGQKQRIAIARALVRDPKVLLLDEATSALDTESEAIVQSALDKARLGRTTIIVAHRLSTIKTADVIYGIKDGVVYEHGTHAELMQQEGIYYQLVTNQQMVEAEEKHAAVDVDEVPSSPVARTVSRSSTRSLKHGVSRLLSHTSDVTDTKHEKEKEVPISRLMKLNSSEWYFILFGCLAAIVHGGIQPIFGVLFGRFLGVFGPYVDDCESDIVFYALMFIVIGVGSAISMFMESAMFGLSGEALTLRLRKMIFRALLRQEMSFFDRPENSTGALSTRLSTDASAIQGATGSRLGMAFQALASIGVGLVIGFIYSWKLTLFIMIFAPLLILAGMLQMKLAKGFSSSSSKVLEDAGKLATESISNIRTVAALTKEPKFVEEYTNLVKGPLKDNLRKSHINGISFSFSQSIIFFAYAAIFTFGAYLIEQNEIFYDDMFIVFGAVVFGAMAVGQASQFAPDYGKAKTAANRVFPLLDYTPSIDSFSTDGTIPGSCSGVIEFKGVKFNYPTRPSVTVLSSLDLIVEQGKTVALVGSSGCGKSTSVQLLERFYDTTSGVVTVDGRDIKTLNLAWLRSQIGIVSQEPVLFAYSIRENVAYGDNSREVTMAEIINAAKQANIHTFIESLPEGYETNVGDKGAQLSGGQKQRIAIARALVRNPTILLLDEATSALDTESEKVVQEALDKAQEGRTCIVIAHRLSTIQNADTIVVIDNGHVAEQGNHSNLMAAKNLYYRLNLAQAMKK